MSVERRERFQILSEATFEGIFFHENGHILEINQALEQMFGLFQRQRLSLEKQASCDKR